MIRSILNINADNNMVTGRSVESEKSFFYAVSTGDLPTVKNHLEKGIEEKEINAVWLGVTPLGSVLCQLDCLLFGKNKSNKRKAKKRKKFIEILKLLVKHNAILHIDNVRSTVDLIQHIQNAIPETHTILREAKMDYQAALPFFANVGDLNFVRLLLDKTSPNAKQWSTAITTLYNTFIRLEYLTDYNNGLKNKKDNYILIIFLLMINNAYLIFENESDQQIPILFRYTEELMITTNVFTTYPEFIAVFNQFCEYITYHLPPGFNKYIASYIAGYLFYPVDEFYRDNMPSNQHKEYPIEASLREERLKLTLREEPQNSSSEFLKSFKGFKNWDFLIDQHKLF